MSMAQVLIERRKRKRILTLKNAGWAAVVLFVAIVAVSIQSEMRHGVSGGYGRLLGKQVATDSVAKPKFDVVKEAPVADETAADPLLIAPAAREQDLGVTNGAIQQAATNVTTAQPLDAPRGGHVAIVGGADGVTIARGTGETRPVLAGGIFRQH